MATKKAKKKAPAKKPVRKSPELIALGRIEHLLQQLVELQTAPLVRIETGPAPTLDPQSVKAALETLTAPTDAELLS
jgi:hypothetical protein